MLSADAETQTERIQQRTVDQIVHYRMQQVVIARERSSERIMEQKPLILLHRNQARPHDLFCFKQRVFLVCALDPWDVKAVGWSVGGWVAGEGGVQ